MFVMGTLALLQVGWLPGWCVVRLARLERFGPPLVLSFALSQIINFFLVQVLTALGLYQPPVLLAVIALELLAALWLGRDLLARPLAADVQHMQGALARLWALAPATRPWRVIGRGLIVVALICLAFYVLAWGSEIGRTLHSWDEVYSWNRWALEWASGDFRLINGLYPHLMPINWSVIYLLVGDSTGELFIKVITPAYATLIVYLMGWYAVRRQDPFVLVGMTFLATIMLVSVGWVFLYGYADLPVTFFGFLALLLALQGPAAMPCMVAVAIGAALTKGSGVVLAGCVLLVAAPWLSRRQFATAAIVMAIAILPQYLTRSLVLLPKLPGLEVQQQVLMVTGLGVEGASTFIAKDLPTRFVDSVVGLIRPISFEKLRQLSPDLFSPAITTLEWVYAGCFVAAVIVALLALAEKPWRWLVVALVPYALLWAVNFGYDNRNLAPVLPILAMCLSVGASRLMRPWMSAARSGVGIAAAARPLPSQ